MKSIIDRIKGWSTKKKILAGIAAFFLFTMCLGVIVGEQPTENSTVEKSSEAPGEQPIENGTVKKSLEAPEELIAISEFRGNPGWQEQGRINEGHWYAADQTCMDNKGKFPEYSEDNFNVMLDAASASSKNLGIAMPTFSELNNMQSVYAGTLASSDTWADAYHANRKVTRMFTKGADRITREKFGTIDLRDSRIKAWINGNDGSADRALHQQYVDNYRMLGIWFACGTAKLQ